MGLGLAASWLPALPVNLFWMWMVSEPSMFFFSLGQHAASCQIRLMVVDQ